MRSLRKSIFSWPRFSFQERDSCGFASAQWVVLIVFTILLMSTFVNILLIENVRATTLASLRDAAREGTRVVDLQNAVDNGDGYRATDACITRLRNSITQMNGANTSSALCTIETDPTTGKLFMKASIKIGTTGIVPWASAFNSRLGLLESTYVPTRAAK